MIQSKILALRSSRYDSKLLRILFLLSGGSSSTWSSVNIKWGEADFKWGK